MKRERWQSAHSVLLLCAFSLPACSAPTGEDSGGTAAEPVREPIAAEVGPDWVGDRVGANAGKWYYRGQMDEPAGAPRDPALMSGADPESDTSPADTGGFVFGDGTDGSVREIEMDAESLMALAREFSRLGYDRGTFEEGQGDLALVAEATNSRLLGAWGNGDDDRAPLGLNEFSPSTSPYKAIGQLRATSGYDVCSGAFVSGPSGAYYVLTAAHCLWNASNGAYVTLNFEPRRDGCKAADGTTNLSNCDPTPYGSWPVVGWMMPAYYYDNCRVTSQSSGWIWCNAQDITILRVNKPSDESYPGALGFYYWGFNDLQSAHVYHRGYPGCWGTGDPITNCRPNTLYGDKYDCQLGQALQPDGDGWGKLITHGCDSSPGMSGSPMYEYYNGLATLVGVHRGGNDTCFSGCSDATPNHMRRITPIWYGQMSAWMGL